MKAIFTFDNYKSYLHYRVSDEFRERGLITKMADWAGCQRSYLSQVLSREVHLTTDHALGLCEGWSFNSEQEDFFILLVEMEKASTERLRSRIRGKLANIRKQQGNLKKRFKASKGIDKEFQREYYSSWHWAAIHIITGIESYQTAPSIAHRLQLPENIVQKCLQLLERHGLIIFQNKRWTLSTTNLHLDRQSPLSSQNHNNWRQLATLRSQLNVGTNIHYSSIFSISCEDYEKLYHQTLDFLDTTRKDIIHSKDEEISCLSIDFFKI